MFVCLKKDKIKQLYSFSTGLSLVCSFSNSDISICDVAYCRMEIAHMGLTFYSVYL